MTNPLDSKYLPWDEPFQWCAWLLLLIAATIFIHNGMRVYNRSRLHNT